jgi:hypothetical protein
MKNNGRYVRLWLNITHFFGRILYFFKRKVAKVTGKPLKSVPIYVAEEKDLQGLGRTVGSAVSLSSRNPKPYLVLGNEILDEKSSEEVRNIQADLRHINACAAEGPSTMQCIKNKKTGAVVVCPGNISRIKEMFNDDWVIVESEIKE